MLHPLPPPPLPQTHTPLFPRPSTTPPPLPPRTNLSSIRFSTKPEWVQRSQRKQKYNLNYGEVWGDILGCHPTLNISCSEVN